MTGLLSVDLPEAFPSSLRMKASLVTPDGWDAEALLICLPGGGASRRYFELGEYEGVDFGFASRMAKHGFASLLIDHPGTGDNVLADDFPFFTPRQAVDILGAAIPKLIKQAGISPRRLICVAHSMGGMMATLLQARHRLFSGMALFGSSARGLDWGLTPEELTYIDQPDALERDLEDLVLKRYGALFPAGLGGPSGKSITFGGSSEELTKRLREVATPLFAAGATTSMTRGAFAPEAAIIDVPMLFAFGDHDIGAPAEEVPQDFPNAADIQTLVLEQTGHNHFAFPTIVQLADTVAEWAAGIS